MKIVKPIREWSVCPWCRVWRAAYAPCEVPRLAKHGKQNYMHSCVLIKACIQIYTKKRINLNMSCVWKNEDLLSSALSVWQNDTEISVICAQNVCKRSPDDKGYIVPITRCWNNFILLDYSRYRCIFIRDYWPLEESCLCIFFKRFLPDNYIFPKSRSMPSQVVWKRRTECHYFAQSAGIFLRVFESPNAAPVVYEQVELPRGAKMLIQKSFNHLHNFLEPVSPFLAQARSWLHVGRGDGNHVVVVAELVNYAFPKSVICRGPGLCCIYL